MDDQHGIVQRVVSNCALGRQCREHMHVILAFDLRIRGYRFCIWVWEETPFRNSGSGPEVGGRVKPLGNNPCEATWQSVLPPGDAAGLDQLPAPFQIGFRA
jgi:hypothetical protein